MKLSKFEKYSNLSSYFVSHDPPKLYAIKIMLLFNLERGVPTRHLLVMALTGLRLQVCVCVGLQHKICQN